MISMVYNGRSTDKIRKKSINIFTLISRLSLIWKISHLIYLYRTKIHTPVYDNTTSKHLTAIFK